MSDEYAIRINDVSTRFGKKIVHEGISLDLKKGEILGLVGGSGCGKTTLLREIIGLQEPTQGEIIVMGKSLQQLSSKNSIKLRNNCGVLFQKGALFSVLDVFENIAFPLREIGFDNEEIIKRIVFMKLDMVGLTPEDAWLKPADLSGGMTKRVALARTLVLEPGLLLLDEPTSGLDPISSEEFVQLLKGLHEALNFTVMMVTHDLDILRDLCTKVAVLSDAKLVAFGSLASVLDSEHPFIKQFFHNNRAKRVFQYK